MTSTLCQLPNTYRAFYGSFEKLSSAQQQLIQPILNGQDIVLQAGTGSGKTEAILAPATEKIISDSKQASIIYIVPTRALALDMYRRIRPIYKRLGIKAGIQTGDLKRKGGSQFRLLITTPESFDVLLGSQNIENHAFVKRTRFLIIDEVHTFLHHNRGKQLSYLCHRLQLISRFPLQTITLSATIVNSDSVISFFKLSNSAFCYQEPNVRQLQANWVFLKNEENELPLFIEDLHKRMGYQKILVFANTRKDCERLHSLMNLHGPFAQKTLLHYSNLSTKVRRSIEEQFRKQRKALCIATSTLELGIDIGDVDGVVLITPPHSISTFLQRIGRSNRRETFIKFWGVCQGKKAAQQLLRFLALFQLAEENKLEFSSPGVYHSVLFQQILSCLYTKKNISLASLQSLYPNQADELQLIFQHMISNGWLKSNRIPGLFFGGWRYYRALKEQKIWSNFPDTGKEYDVILEEETIASLPQMTVRQFDRNDYIQLAGKSLRILQIIETDTIRQVLTEKVNKSHDKTLSWRGCGIPVPYEVAQSVSNILLNDTVFPGLYSRTKQLLKDKKASMARTVKLENGIRVSRLGNGIYRYETFLGTIGNFILQHIIQTKLEDRFEDFWLTYDELAIESTHWITFQELTFPETLETFKGWLRLHIHVFRQVFPWSCWTSCLPENLKYEEMVSRILDPRLIKHFKKYNNKSTKIIEGEASQIHWEKNSEQNDIKNPLIKSHKAKHLCSLEEERQEWGKLSFPEFPCEGHKVNFLLTGSNISDYIRYQLCPRWTRLNFLNYTITPHSRFTNEQNIHRRCQQQDIAFKKQLFQTLEEQENILWEGPDFTWKDAINKVCSNGQSFFLAKPHLEISSSSDSFTYKGIPDLLYIHYEESHISLELWDNKNSNFPRYHQKWKIAFHAYLLSLLLENEIFCMKIKLSNTAGILHRNIRGNSLFEKHVFPLTPYLSLMPRLLTRWKEDAIQNPSAQEYRLQANCTCCPYFSYCYQQSLFENPLSLLSSFTPNMKKKWDSVQVNELADCLASLQDSPSPPSMTVDTYNHWREQIHSLQHKTIGLITTDTDAFPQNVNHWYFLSCDFDWDNPKDCFIQFRDWDGTKTLEEKTWYSNNYSSWEDFQKDVATYIKRSWESSVKEQKWPHFIVYDETHWHSFHKLFQSSDIEFLWAYISCYTSIKSLIKKHFSWPIWGELSVYQLANCLGIDCKLPRPLSFLHSANQSYDFYQEKKEHFDFYPHLWQWCLDQLKSFRVLRYDNDYLSKIPLIQDYYKIIEMENNCRKFSILQLQSNSLAERVKRFRSIGPIRWRKGTGSSPKKRNLKYNFSFDSSLPIAKFRKGDFLKLSPIGSPQIQDGFPVVLNEYLPEKGILSVESLFEAIPLNKRQLYALDEDATDWNSSKVFHILKQMQKQEVQSNLLNILHGHAKEEFDSSSEKWLDQWLQTEGKRACLNVRQQKALKLAFRTNIGLIEGPPGTGKTHLLIWTFIALYSFAKFSKRPLRLLVTAQTHRAIDQILCKVDKVLNSMEIKNVTLWKYGRYDDKNFEESRIEQITNADVLNQVDFCILGATGFGIYKFLEGKNFPHIFDWVIFDEASQILVPYAFLGLIFSKGNALFYGDTQQLSPIVLANYKLTPKQPESILQYLISRYSKENYVRLNESYRMNKEICSFPSEQWYDGDLRPSVDRENQKLKLPLFPLFTDHLDKQLDPEHSMVLLELDHVNCQQSSQEEAEWIAKAVKRLVEDYQMDPKEIGVISPYRLQNNTILQELKKKMTAGIPLPRVDTVERMQGAEYDLVFFSATSSDDDLVHSSFLKNFRRFNVAITRARKKFIFVASSLFFQNFPLTEDALIAQKPFEDLYRSVSVRIDKLSKEQTVS